MSHNLAANHRVLIIDDTESIHQDFRKTLVAPNSNADLHSEAELLFGTPLPKSGHLPFELESALQGQEGLAKVAAAVAAGRPFAVTFVDMRMPPGWDGVQTIEELWKADPNLQVVICTAYADYSWDAIVERLGTSDRLLILKKPFDSAEVRQLALALTEKWGMTQRASLKLDQLERIVIDRTAELRHAAGHDSLTGLPNRAGLCDKLRELLERPNLSPQSATAPHDFALMFLDFDRFKIINDSLGHEIGDQLLVCIARRLRSVLAEPFGEPVPADKVMAARLGGDEFVILVDLPNARAHACKLADRLLGALRPSYDLLGHEVFSTASIGITTSEFDYCRASDVLRDADAAMYRAKAQGKDRYVVFDRSMHDLTLTRLQMETDLRNALAHDELGCCFQPIVALADGAVRGLEALMRWNHPVRGAVPPSDFIPVAEDTGLMTPLGLWILKRSLQQFADWRSRPDLAPSFIAVNMSKRQLLEPGLVRVMADEIAAAGIPPECVVLEITESIIMDRADAVTPVLHRLKDLGVKIWMDDFGTGHSSLSCIHTFPLDGLKIDRAFIRNLDTSPKYLAVVQAIVTLAKRLSLTVVAEGIETSQQSALVQDLGCDHGQGWLFSKPLAANDCIPLLEQRRIIVPSSSAPQKTEPPTKADAA